MPSGFVEVFWVEARTAGNKSITCMFCVLGWCPARNHDHRSDHAVLFAAAVQQNCFILSLCGIEEFPKSVTSRATLRALRPALCSLGSLGFSCRNCCTAPKGTHYQQTPCCGGPSLCVLKSVRRNYVKPLFDWKDVRSGHERGDADRVLDGVSWQKIQPCCLGYLDPQ